MMVDESGVDSGVNPQDQIMCLRLSVLPYEIDVHFVLGLSAYIFICVQCMAHHVVLMVG